MSEDQIKAIAEQIKGMSTDELWQLAGYIIEGNNVAAQWLKADIETVEN